MTNATSNTAARHTVRELTPAIGATVGVRFEKLIIDCTVVDAKNSYGQTRLLVRPAAGVGEQWIELSRLCATAGTLASTSLSTQEAR